ncbi:gephyrin-like molybdotransferase receptor GlpR [Aldersonia kunmingensis]|uniref:divisome protein SepX/GlpR n=1 Tax=Aldersonia kunmingensis TaxID=408066 RepID=UPI00082A72C1|nr:gephyrin-like molybdotransferase receptor GlpR [Aldersonia kunmingensis]
MPNSFLWIGLVGMWVFILFPMMAGKHPRIRRPTDAALSTRVLHRGGTKRKPARGPATGHESDPNWRRATEDRRTHSRGTDWEDPMETHADSIDLDDEDIRNDDRPDDAVSDDMVSKDAVPDDEAERGEEPAATADDKPAEEPVRRVPSSEVAELEDDWGPRDNEPVRERGSDGPEEHRPHGGIPVRRGRGGFDPEADAIARAERYQFRQRAVLGLLLIAIMSAAIGVIASSLAWWACGASVAILAMYLTYLRNQVRMEEEIRRRRMARLARSRLGVESTTDEELRLVPSRLRRPGAVIIEVDDEDPAFEHLDHPHTLIAEGESDDEMRTASGQ